MLMAVRTPLVLGIDAGGTMTDTFIVDEAGGFEVGKAPTTPEDESVGFLESTEDAIHYWGMELEELFPKLEVTLYSGTTMLNTLLTRRGQRVGLLVTNGFEDMLLMNRGLIWAYAAAPVRQQLLKVQERIHGYGFKSSLQTVLSYGGLANVRYPRLHETLVSGPIGGILGAQYIAGIICANNVMVTDMGGTSFDIGAITAGSVPVNPEPTLARFKLNLPTIALETIGAGSGMVVKVDPATRKVELGPESAGADPGPVCFGRGGQTATVCDCTVVLGYLNPDYFLGGRIKLDTKAALAAVKEQVTDPIGVDVYEGSEGVVRMLETRARDALK